ncbi:MAG: hypothetical protein R3D03_14275 [Geminicoccaceae bacterium]
MTTYASVARRLAEREDPGSRAKLIEAIHKVTREPEGGPGWSFGGCDGSSKGREEMGCTILARWSCGPSSWQ